VPTPTTETLMPVRPRVRVCMAANMAGRADPD
jgi:hypothetical protein